jgi:GDP-L-fucose synthase
MMAAEPGRDGAVAYPLDGKRVWVAGHGGMVGSALQRALEGEGCDVLTVGRAALDLRRQEAVEAWLAAARPQAVLVAAATVGGILANQAAPGAFLYDNLMIAANVIAAAHRVGVEKLLFLGSSCIYPRAAAQPISEDALLGGPLEPTNQWYAVAKIAGVKLCQAYRQQYGCDFIAALPTNLYGPGDSFDDRSAHVIPALIGRMHGAAIAGRPEVAVWGSGRARREFLYVDDCAAALVHLMKVYSDARPVNVGTGSDITIAALAELIRAAVGYRGRLVFDREMPDGTPVKRLDISTLRGLGWQARTGLEDGLARTCAWYRDMHGG